MYVVRVVDIAGAQVMWNSEDSLQKSVCRSQFSPSAMGLWDFQVLSLGSKCLNDEPSCKTLILVLF